MLRLLRSILIPVLLLLGGAPQLCEAGLPGTGYVPRLSVPSLEAPSPSSGLRLLAEEAYDVAKLNDGTVLVGKIIRENEVGVVFRSTDGKTRLIKYEELADLQSTRAGARPASAAPVPAPTASPKLAPALPSALTPAQADRRRMLAAERDGLVKRRAEINLLPSTLGLIGGLVIMGVTPLLFTNSTERTAGFITGGLIAGLGALGLIFKVTARGQLDRQIRDKNREIQRLYPETTRRPAGPSGLSGFEVALVWRG